MVIFSKITGGVAAFGMLYFLLRSRYAPQKGCPGKHIFCIFLCCTLLCLQFHWAADLGFSALAACLLALFIGNTKWTNSLLFGLLFGILRAVSFVISFALQQVIPNLAPVPVLLAEQAVLYLLVVVVSLFFSQWRTTPQPLLRAIPPWLVTVLLCVICLVTPRRDSIAIFECFACLWLVYSGILLQQIVSRMEIAQQTFMEQQQKSRQYTMQEEYYQQLRQKQSETRALWHDLNKYLRAAKAESDSTQALAQLEQMLDSVMEIVDVGNPVLNVILNEYTQSAKALGIELRMRVQVSSSLQISVADLYILLGNTMDNAIEACKMLPAHQRLINLTLRTHYDVLYYKLINPYDPQAKKTARVPMRGYGLENVRRCVARYNGSLETKQDQGFFIVSAHLNQLPNGGA